MKEVENKLAKQCSKIVKKQYDKVEFKIADAVNARLGLKKSFTNLVMCLDKKILNQKRQNIEQYLNACEKNIEICKRTTSFAANVDQYFKTDCLQSL